MAGVWQGVVAAAPEAGGLLAVTAVVAVWTWWDLRRWGAR